MSYGTIKVDTITFTDGGVDKSVSVSGLTQNPTITGNLTVTGTISGDLIQGQTVSGATITGGDGQFTTITGTTVNAGTVNAVSGVFTNISGSTVVLTSGVFASGTAAAPSVSIGATDNGLYSPGTDQVAISTNGIQRVTIDSLGNLLVGLTSAAGIGGTPADLNSVEIGRGYINISRDDTAAADHILFGKNGSIASSIGTSTTNSLIFKIGTTEQMRLDSSGRLGLGTSNPQNLFSLGLPTGTTSRILGQYGNNEAPTLEVGVGQSSTFRGGMRIAVTDTGAGSVGDSVVSFHTTKDGGGTVQRLTIDQDGKVGIGTTSVSTTLDIHGTPAATTGGIIRIRDTQTTTGTAGKGGIHFSSSPGIDFYIAKDYDPALTPTVGLNFGNASTGASLMRLTANGLGIGTTSPQELLDLYSTGNTTLRISGSSGGGSDVSQIDFFRIGSNVSASLKALRGGGNSEGQLAFYTATSGTPTEKARIDSSGRLLVGTSSARTNFYNATISALLQQEGAASAGDPASRFMSLTYGKGNTDSGVFIFAKHRATTVGGQTVVVDGDSLGEINFQGSDGTEFVPAASIRAAVDGTPGANDMPGRLVFSTTADGSSSPTERMRIDSAGRVGIGTASPTVELDIERTTGTVTVQLQSRDSSECAIDFGDNADGDVGRIVYNHGNNYLGFTTNASERARIDSSGRLLVGTSSSQTIGNSAAQLQLSTDSATGYAFSLTRAVTDIYGPQINFRSTRGTAASPVIVNNGDQLGSIAFYGYDGSDSNNQFARIAALVDGTPGSDDCPGMLVFSTTADGASSPTERMRINNRGQTFVISTSNTFYSHSTQPAGTTYVLYAGRNSATTIDTGNDCFYVYTNGNVQNTNNSYGQISDIKLKENIVDAASQWSDLKSVRVRNFNFKEGQTHRQIGVIAQELEEVSPGLVYETPDRDEEGNETGEVTKGVNYSVLYMKAVKALQEAMERIETLEQRLNDAGIA